jgi:hypothetical protein
MAAGQSPTGIKPVELAPDQVIQKLLRDPDPGIRIRAAEYTLKREERQTTACPVCAARNAERGQELDWRLVTEEQKAALSALLIPLKVLTATIKDRVHDLSRKDRAIALAEKLDDDLVADQATPDGVDTFDPAFVPPVVKSKPTNREDRFRKPDVYDRDRILHEVEYVGADGLMCLADDRGDIPDGARRTERSVKLRAAAIDATAQRIEAANLVKVQQQFNAAIRKCEAAK